MGTASSLCGICFPAVFFPHIVGSAGSAAVSFYPLVICGRQCQHVTARAPLMVFPCLILSATQPISYVIGIMQPHY